MTRATPAFETMISNLHGELAATKLELFRAREKCKATEFEKERLLRENQEYRELLWQPRLG
jgi:hypothetical protein